MITYTYESSSSSSKHRTTVHDDGRIVCTCRGFRTPAKCWHVEDAYAGGLKSVERSSITTQARADATATATKTAAVYRASASEMESRGYAQAAVLDRAFAEHHEEIAARNASAPVIPPKPMLAVALTKAADTGGGRGREGFIELIARQLRPFENTAYVLEEKLDGIRWLVHKSGSSVVAYSRPGEGREHGLPQTISPRMKAAILELPDGWYDGELVTPGGRSWNVSRLDSEKRLVLFDVIELLGASVTSRSYTERRAMLIMAVRHHNQNETDREALISVPAVFPVSLEAVMRIWAAGGEGAMVKRVAATYQCGRRSPDWVKVKQLHHATVTIIGFKKGKAASTTPWSVTCLRTDDGRETTVSTLNNATIAAISRDPQAWIGRRLVIYYTELTDSGSFRHAGWDHLAGEGE